MYYNKCFVFADSAIERRHLRSQANQKLRQFCQSLGLQLVTVELFELIPSSVQQQNDVCKDNIMYELEARGLLEMAKKEIKLCQEISLGPTFVVIEALAVYIMLSTVYSYCFCRLDITLLSLFYLYSTSIPFSTFLQTLLAQRYGHKPLHQTIPEDDFKLLVTAIDEYSMRQLVSQWYRLDMNAVPPEYVLQSHGGM